MARPLERVGDINDGKELWKVAVKIHHKWSVLSNKKESFEMVVYDKEGCEIHVIVPPMYNNTFDSVFAVNDTYTITNFQVQLNDLLFKPSPHKYLVKFTGGTKVGDRNKHKISAKECKVTPFLDILAGNWSKDRLIDVIGLVDEMGYTQPQAGGKKQQVNFVMRDLSNNTINCTLWEAYATQFINFIQQHTDASIPVVVFIQFAKVKEESGKYPLSVTNTYNVTKVTINEDIEPITKFTNSITKGTLKPLSSHHSQQTQGLSQNYSGSHQTPYQKLTSNAVALPLKEITKLTQTTFCATVATPKKLFASKYGWYYQACHECPNKVTGDNPPFLCSKGHSTETTIFRYKIEVDAVHGGSNSKFVFWDKESEEILGVSAADMRNTMIESGIYDPLEFPLALDKMLGEEIAFKVKWQPDWSNCSVIMLNTDKAVIAQLKSHWNAEVPLISQPLSTTAPQIKESVDEAAAVDECDIVTDLEITSKLHAEPVTPVAKRQIPHNSSESTTVAGDCEGDLSSTKLKKVPKLGRKGVKVEPK